MSTEKHKKYEKGKKIKQTDIKILQTDADFTAFFGYTT